MESFMSNQISNPFGDPAARGPAHMARDHLFPTWATPQGVPLWSHLWGHLWGPYVEPYAQFYTEAKSYQSHCDASYRTYVGPALDHDLCASDVDRQEIQGPGNNIFLIFGLFLGLSVYLLGFWI